VVEERSPAAATPSDVAESSRRAVGAGSHRSEEIPVGEPIIPPYKRSKALPFARLLHEDRTIGASPGVDGESSDSLLEDIKASPPPFEYYHGEQLEDDPQLMVENMKKFQAVVREFTKFSVVSTFVECHFPFVRIFLLADCVIAANGQSVVSKVSEAESD